MDISEATIRKSLKSRGMYETPELNETLLLHNLGIRGIPFLPTYVNVITLILYNNCIGSISNLGSMPMLKYLNLANNLLSEVDLSEDFIGLNQLEEVHLSNNKISRLSGLDGRFVAPIKVLKLDGNRLDMIHDFSKLVELEVLSLKNNLIADKSSFDSNLFPISLRQLYLSPNEFVGSMRQYRRTLITGIPSLVFLDSTPVTDAERELAFLELKGDKEGVIAVCKERQAGKLNEMKKTIQDFRSFQNETIEVSEGERLKAELFNLFI
jgi:Leucine-rich repeat (LRR) protein